MGQHSILPNPAEGPKTLVRLGVPRYASRLRGSLKSPSLLFICLGESLAPTYMSRYRYIRRMFGRAAMPNSPRISRAKPMSIVARETPQMSAIPPMIRVPRAKLACAI